MAKPPIFPPQSDLDAYRSKRTGGATPEPMASVAEGATANESNVSDAERTLVTELQSAAVANSGPAPVSATTLARGARMFVVHEHHATRNHFDLRLEIDGVLISWAIPHGPSMNPDEKRLAVKVEAHPLEYANFEAVIPAGNYGAGPMICWDRGRFAPIGDPAQGITDGEVKFELHGYKLRGAFTLVHTGKKRSNAPSRAGAAGPHDWLLIKKRDVASDAFLAGSAALSSRSVLSGLTVQELEAGAATANVIVSTLAAFGAPKRPLSLVDVTPMLCQTAERAFSDPAWLYELKYDGYRGQAAAGMGQGTLRYRSGKIATERFPEIASALRALPYRNLIIDGELVFFDHQGKPDFQKLAGRAQLSRASEILRASVASPVTYVVFDLIAIEGYDLRELPLRDRKALLAKIIPSLGPLKYADHIEQQGEAMLQAVAAQGLEGVVAKRAASPYRGVRHADWQKLKIDPEGDFAICGYTPPKGSRAGLGALHLCIWHQETWLWAGKVGTGFDDNMLMALRAQLDALTTWKPTFPKPQGSSDARWIAPSLVCQVRYREWPVDHALRFPVFERLRPDKTATQCTMPKRHTGDGHIDAQSTTAGGDDNSPIPSAEYQADIAVRELRLSNPKKVYWPKTENHPAVLKGQLIEYYRSIAPWILPYLRDRPTVLTRFPDGIDGNWFYQKDMPDWTPPWLRTVNLWSEGSQREIHYLLVDDEDGLAYVANLGSIPIHSWASTTDDLERPTWTIIDLDPKGAPREHVVPLALAIHELCETIGLPNYVKTSGQTGLHIMMPLARQCTYDNARNLALLLSSIIEQRLPTLCTTNKNPKARGGKVFLDWGQNAHGQLLVAPFSVRPVAGAPVSMPMRWSEITPEIAATDYHIGNAVERMRSLAADPCLPVLTESPNLADVMAKLEEVMKAPLLTKI